MGILAQTSQVSTDTSSKPTLTEAGEKLLNVMVDPQRRTWSVSKICRAAGISRDSFYRLFKNQDFIQLYFERCKIACVSWAHPVINAMANAAINGDVAAGKILLEMAGMYQHVGRVEIYNTHDVGPSLKDILHRRGALAECIDITPAGEILHE